MTFWFLVDPRKYSEILGKSEKFAIFVLSSKSGFWIQFFVLANLIKEVEN